MSNRNSIAKTLLALLLLISISISSLGASRTISSQTIHIYGYVPERTTLELLEDGNFNFSSNNPSATIDVQQFSNSTTLSVTAI
ncbi:MAG: hypothetical protein EOM67_07920 [Spirochaetia bacterium]|nr:hypothetical protein [Spirochaetia bacterium]